MARAREKKDRQLYRRRPPDDVNRFTIGVFGLERWLLRALEVKVA
jgi:hypothetical protein